MADRREDLEAMWDEMAAEPEAEPAAVEAEPVAAPEPAEAGHEPTEEAGDTRTAAERARDEQGRFAKADKQPAKAQPATPKTPPAAPADAQAATPAQPAAQPVRAPQSWKPAVRDAFAKLPPDMQRVIGEEVNRRERETAIALQRASEAGKGIQPWQDAIRPYEAQIRSAGQEPHQYVGELLKTAHLLTYAPPQQKAAVLADIIAQFGVPPQDLDQALVARMQGRPMQQPQQAQLQPDVRALLREEIAGMQHAAMARQAEEQASSLSQKLEFYDDVAPQMADILDVWAKQGKKTVTEDDINRAHNIACSLNDDVREALEQRKKADAVRTTSKVTARARAASSSIRSQPTAAPAAQPVDRREALESMYDELAGQ